MAAVNQAEADELARRWVSRAAPGAEAVLHEFARGWVISARFPVGGPDPTGVPNMVLDRESGELVVGGTRPPSDIAEWYQRGSRPSADPTAGPRVHPATMSRLAIDGRSRVARSLRADTDRPLHPVVATFFDTMPPEYRERGCERSSEAVVFSDLFHSEDDARAEAGLPALTLSDARDLVRGARVDTFRIREDADPANGTAVRPALPVLLFLDYLGLDPDAAGPDTAATG